MRPGQQEEVLHESRFDATDNCGRIFCFVDSFVVTPWDRFPLELFGYRAMIFLWQDFRLNVTIRGCFVPCLSTCVILHCALSCTTRHAFLKACRKREKGRKDAWSHLIVPHIKPSLLKVS